MPLLLLLLLLLNYDAIIIHAHSSQNPVSVGPFSASRKSQRYIFYAQLPVSHARSTRSRQCSYINVLFGLGEERTFCKNKKAMGMESEHNNYRRLDDKKGTHFIIGKTWPDSH